MFSSGTCVAIQDLSNLLWNCMPSVDHRIMAPSHVKERHCYYNGLPSFIVFFFLLGYAVSTKAGKGGEDDGGGDEGEGGARRGNTGGSRRGGFGTSRYNYGIPSYTFSHFFSKCIWATVPWQFFLLGALLTIRQACRRQR